MGCASTRSRSVMKCAAAAIRRSASLAELLRLLGVSGSGGQAGKRVEGEDLRSARHRRAVRTSSSATSRGSRAGDQVDRIHRRQQAVAQARPARRRQRAMPSGCLLEHRPGSAVAGRVPEAPCRDAHGPARRGGRRRSPRPSRPRAPAWQHRRRSPRPGTAPDPGSTSGTPRSERTRADPRSRRPAPRCVTASSKRYCSRASSPSTASPRTCNHGSSTCRSQSDRPRGLLDAAVPVARRDGGPRGEQGVRGLVPRPVQPVVERAAAVGQVERGAEVALVRHDVREVVAASRPQLDVVERPRPVLRPRPRAHGPRRGARTTPRSTRRAAAHRHGRWRMVRRLPRRGRRRGARRPDGHRAPPRPSRTRSRCAARAAGHGRRPR